MSRVKYQFFIVAEGIDKTTTTVIKKFDCMMMTLGSPFLRSSGNYIIPQKSALVGAIQMCSFGAEIERPVSECQCDPANRVEEVLCR